MGNAAGRGLHSVGRLANREKMNISKDVKEVRERAMWISQGRALGAEGMACARALGKQHTWKSKEARVARGQ